MKMKSPWKKASKETKNFKQRLLLRISHPSFVTRPTPMKVIEAPTIGTTSISQQKKGLDFDSFERQSHEKIATVAFVNAIFCSNFLESSLLIL